MKPSEYYDRKGHGFTLSECPYPGVRGGCACDTPCARCGFPKHFAVHLVPFNQPAGSAPWGHQWRPKTN